MELYRIFKCFTRKKFTFYVYFNFNQGYYKFFLRSYRRPIHQSTKLLAQLIIVRGILYDIILGGIFFLRLVTPLIENYSREMCLMAIAG